MTSPDHPDAGGKRCTKCGEWKPWGGFNRCKRDAGRGGEGFGAWCKSCKYEHHATNYDRIAERKRDYHKVNRDRIAEQTRRYREANRDRRAEKDREYRESNRDRIAAYKRKWGIENRDRKAEKDREYRESKRDDLDYRAQRNARHLKRRARKRSLPSETVLLREIALRDGATCWMCGDELSEWNPAHLDHLVPLSATADQLAAWSLENPGTVRANMALACPSCNIRKSNRLMPCALARYLRNLSAESELAA